MKKYIMILIFTIIMIILTLSLFLSMRTCNNTKHNVYKTNEKQIIKIDKSTIDEETIILQNLNLKLKKFNRHWSEYNKRTAVKALKAGEDEFNIDHRIVLSLMSLESGMKIIITNKNADKTIDFGLTMQNSRYINARYKACEKILQRRKIKYSNSKFDIAKNIMACFLYINDIKKIHNDDFKRLIMAYNIGIRGTMMKDKQQKGEKYFMAFVKHYNDFSY